MNEQGYGVCRSVEDALNIAEKAREEGLRGCYPSAAVVLTDELKRRVPATLEAAAPFDYVAEAILTRSDDWHGEKVSFAMFRTVLASVVDSLNDLDAIKKTLFYGRDLPEHLRIDGLHENDTCKTLPHWFKNDKFGEYVLHSIIGAATEAGELIEALRAVVVEGKPFDEVNMREEVGDVFWYFAILADTCGFKFEESQRVNIAKLRARYPNKFTAFDANNRNLSFERSILEGVGKVAPCIGHAFASDEEEKISS